MQKLEGADNLRSVEAGSLSVESVGDPYPSILEQQAADRWRTMNFSTGEQEIVVLTFVISHPLFIPWEDLYFHSTLTLPSLYPLYPHSTLTLRSLYPLGGSLPLLYPLFTPREDLYPNSTLTIPSTGCLKKMLTFLWTGFTCSTWRAFMCHNVPYSESRVRVLACEGSSCAQQMSPFCRNLA